MGFIKTEKSVEVHTWNISSELRSGAGKPLFQHLVLVQRVLRGCTKVRAHIFAK